MGVRSKGDPARKIFYSIIAEFTTTPVQL